MRSILALLFLSMALFAEQSHWLHEYEKAVKIAKIEKKPIYVLIVSESCRWCKKFEATTLQNERIKERINKEFVTVLLSRDRHTIPKQFKMSPIPRHYFVDPHGNILFSALGYRDADTFNLFMDYALENYKNMKEEKNETSTNK